jgi:hypothetical protein
MQGGAVATTAKSTKNSGGTTRKRTSASSKSRPAASAKATRPTAAQGSTESKAKRAAIATGATFALAGSAAVGVASRARAKRARGPQALVSRVVREMTRRSPDPRQAVKNLDVKKMAKQIGRVAEQVEARSEDVRVISAQAKRLSKKWS